MNDDFRYKVKYLKAFGNITYKEIAEYLDIRQDSFYAWVNGYYNFSEKRLKQLKIILEDLQ